MHIIGSKWFKVDFHCHSPASDDFPRNRDQEKCSYREWLIGPYVARNRLRSS